MIIFSPSVQLLHNIICHKIKKMFKSPIVFLFFFCWNKMRFISSPLTVMITVFSQASADRSGRADRPTLSLLFHLKLEVMKGMKSWLDTCLLNLYFVFSHGFPRRRWTWKRAVNGVVKTETSELNLWIKRFLCLDGNQQNPLNNCWE